MSLQWRTEESHDKWTSINEGKNSSSFYLTTQDGGETQEEMKRMEEDGRKEIEKHGKVSRRRVKGCERYDHWSGKKKGTTTDTITCTITRGHEETYSSET